MSVRVITDNVADLPKDVVARHGLSVVPLGVHFEGESGGENMEPDEFYSRLVTSDPLPTTSAPSPEDFAALYREMIESGDDVIVVTLSAKLSATFGVAQRGVELVEGAGRVHVIDSTMATIAEGFVALEAARAAAEGATLPEVAAAARACIPRIGFLAAFDTLEYLRRGGRIGAAKALLGSMLKIHPLVTLRDGLVAPYGRARSRTQAIESLVDYTSRFKSVEMLAIEHTACAEDAAALRDMLAERFPGVDVIESRATPVIGTHTGPSLLVLSVLGDPK